MESLKKAIITYGKYIKNLHVFEGKRYTINIHSVSQVKTTCTNVLRLNGRKYLRICWRLCFFGSCVFMCQRDIVCFYILEGQSNEPTFYDGDIVLVSNVQLIL